jgi:hypothetical protein
VNEQIDADVSKEKKTEFEALDEIIQLKKIESLKFEKT